MARRYRIEVVVDPSNARAGTQEVRRGLRDATDDARRMGRAITLAFAALGAAGGLAGSTRLLASFGQAMSTVEAVTNSTRGEFRELNAEAQRLGANTRFSATQAAEGMIYLARAGFDANEVLGATEGTLQLAQAGALGLGEAADIASNILQGFRLQVDQTSRVVDVLALAANSSNTDVTQLGDAMAYVAPVAAGLGLQIEETAAAIGALSNAGLQGSMAGTGLRRVLSELESPSQKSRDILASMGVTADEVRISQVGLTAALQRLAEAGIDTGQALEIFGDRGGPAFEVLASSIPDVVRMTEAFNDAEGTAERIANTMDGNLNGAMLRAKSAAEALVLTLGELGATEFLTGAFRGTAGLLSDVVSVLNQTEGASVALEITLKALATTAGVLLVRQIVLLTASVATSAATAFAASGTYTLFTITLARYGAATAVAATASHAFGVAMRFMLGPIGLVIIAIGTLTALWASYRDVAQQARDANQDLYDIQNQVAEQARSVTRLTLQQAEARLVEARATRQQVLEQYRLAQANAVEARRRYDDYVANPAGRGFAAGEAFRRDVRVAEQAAHDARQIVLDNTGTIVQVERQIDRLRASGEEAADTTSRTTQQVSEDYADVISNLGRMVIVLGATRGREREIVNNLLEAGLAPDDRTSAAAQEIIRLTDAVIGLDNAERRSDILADFNAGLAQSTELLNLDRDAREIRSQVLQLNAQLVQSELIPLTEAETAEITRQITELQHLNEVRRAEEGILKSVLDPVRQYRIEMEALNNALQAGRISQEAFDAAVANNTLVRQVQDVDTSLGGDFARDAELEQVRVREAERLNIIQMAREAALLTESEYASRREAIYRASADEILEIERARAVSELNNAESLFGSLADAAAGFAGEQSDLYKTMFAISKAFAIAQSIVNINAAISSAAMSLPFPANLAAMATVAAEVANIVANIQSVTLGFKKGGYTGDGPLDGVAGVVHRREFVMNAAATSAIGRPALEAMNSGKGLAVRAQNKVELHFHGVTEEPRVEESNDGERIDVFLRENQNQNILGGHADGAMRQRFGQKPRLTRR